MIASFADPVNIKASKLELSLFSKAAVEVLGRQRVQDFVRIRNRLLRYIYFFILPDCPSASRLLAPLSTQFASVLATSPHGSGPLVSLVDVMELQTKRYLVPLQEVCSLLYFLVSFFVFKGKEFVFVRLFSFCSWRRCALFTSASVPIAR